jgi:hypothetical protein
MMMNFIYMALGKHSLCIDTADISCEIFSSYEDYLENKTVPDGFIIESHSDDLALDVLKKLRGANDTFLHPIFLCDHAGESFEMLSDGQISTLEEAIAKSEQLFQQQMRLQHDLDDYAENGLLRVLAYLFLRPETVILPFQQWNHPHLYSYPLLEVLAGEDEGSSLVTTLKNRKFITVVDLIDRVRHCPACYYAHFNFIDVCPDCRSIEIEKKPFLHCFSCGNVAPQEQFMADNVLACPQCMTQLRHIGADYDRPLENYVCHDCDSLFQEPDIIAHCQHCGKRNKPDELTPWPVYSYRSTDRVVYAVRTGEVEDVYSLFDELQNINPVHFSYTVDWLLKMCQRYTEELFSLVGIRVTNLPELYKKIGRYRLIELVDGYISRIHEIVRTTDLMTRTVTDIIWILLPKTDPSDCNIIVSRLIDLQSLSIQDEGVQLECDVVTFHAPDHMIAGETGEQLLARLEGGIA